MSRLKKLQLSMLAAVVLVGGLPALAAAAADPGSPAGTETRTPAAPGQPPAQPSPPLDAPAPPPAPDLTEKEGWSELSHWRRNPDGSTTRDLFSTPQFRPTRGGGWATVDPSVKATTKGGVVAAAEGAVRPIRFGADASQLVQLDLDQGPVTLSATGLDVTRPRVADTGVTYSDVAPDTDLRYSVGPAGVKEELVLRSSKSPQQFRFHLSDPAGQLGAVHAQADGSFRFDGQVGSDLVVVLPAPLAYQEPEPGLLVAPTPYGPTSAHMMVTPAGDGFDITVGLDAEWAKDKAFPIVLDPTVVFQPASTNAKEGQVRAAPSNSVMPADTLLTVATNTESVLRGAIAFDTSSIPPSSTISSASLSLYWAGYCLLTNSGMCYGQSYNRNYTINVHRITADPWFGLVTPGSGSTSYAVPFDATVAASTAPRANTTTAQNHPSGWDNWSVTGLVQAWANGQYPNNGFLLKLANEGMDQSGPAYETSHAYHTNDPATRPKLTVTYTASNKPYAPDQLSPNASRFTTSSALQARYRDFSGLAGQVFFEVRNPAGTVVASAWSAQVASGATASWTPPALPDGTYTWRTQAYNGSGYSPWSSSATFALAQAPAGGPGAGELRYYKFETIGLNDRMHVHVNVANGNLVLHEHDLGVAGTGLDLAVDRFYNSQSLASYALGAGWLMGTGRDVGLAVAPDGSQLFEGPSGFRVSFAKNPDGSYRTPTGIDATLVGNADSTYTLTFHATAGKFNFTSGGYLSSDVDRNGNTISFAYTPGSMLSLITDTQGRTTRFGYNGAGQLVSMTDSANRSYQYAYDAAGNLTSYTDPATKATRFAYDGARRMTQVTDPVGNITKFGYDGSGRVSSLTRVTNTLAGTGPTTTYTYNAGNTVSTDANTNKTTYTYDSLGRVTKVVDAAGNETLASYTPNSNVASRTDALNAATIFDYDTKDNLKAATSPTGAASRWTYDDPAHPYLPTGHTNPQGNALAYTYDGPGNLTASQNGLASENQLKFTYNPNGTPATGTDARGNVTYFGYDASGNLTGIGPPMAVNQKTLGYDGLSRLTSVTDAKNQTTSVTYDALDRVTRLSYTDGSSVAYTYDANGNLLRRDDAAGVTTFTYDATNQPLTKAVGGITTTATYDAVGNLLSASDPGGKVTYAYNSVNLLTTLTEPSGAKTTFAYDKAGRRTSTAYPNGVTQTITYDPSGRETRIKATDRAGTVLTDFTYAYTNPATGKDTSLRYRATAIGATLEYSYDALDRLVDAQTSNAGRFQYSYDGNGNRLSQTVGGTTTNYSYDAANRLTAAAGVTYTYDNNGNLTGASDGRSLTYNAKNQTTGIKPPGLLSGSVAMTYAGSTQDERTKAGNTTFTSGFGGVSIASEPGLLGSSNTYYTRDDRGNLVSERLANGTYYYLFDGLGSVVALTDANGSVANRYAYDPYGNAIASGTSGSVVNPWRFAGGHYDSGTGLYKFGIRYYDSGAGRWTQQDPDPGQPLYAYAGDNPVNFVDPSGYSFLSKFKCVASELNPFDYSEGSLVAAGGAAGSAGVAGAKAAAALGAATAGAAVAAPIIVIGAGAALYGAYRIGKKCSRA